MARRTGSKIASILMSVGTLGESEQRLSWKLIVITRCTKTKALCFFLRVSPPCEATGYCEKIGCAHHGHDIHRQQSCSVGSGVAGRHFDNCRTCGWGGQRRRQTCKVERIGAVRSEYVPLRNIALNACRHIDRQRLFARQASHWRQYPLGQAWQRTDQNDRNRTTTAQSSLRQRKLLHMATESPTKPHSPILYSLGPHGWSTPHRSSRLLRPSAT